MRNQKKSMGFTLTELLVTVSIIAILIGGAGYYAAGSTKKSRDAKRIVEVAQIETAINLYLRDHGNFDAILGVPGTPIDGWCRSNSFGERYYQAYYYTTPTHPSGTGRHPWSRLQQHLQSYIDPLPIDLRNGFQGWINATGVANYNHATLLQGYYQVGLISDVIVACSGPRTGNNVRQAACSGQSFGIRYFIETILEDSSNKFTLRNSNPTLFGCIPATDPQAHRMIIWGQ